MSSRTYLSIGDVLSLLRQEFPDVTISKIRFLESQGLVNPERSPSGYRKFHDQDVARLRWVLRQQREHFLPLRVIRDRLEREGDAVLEANSDAPAQSPPATGAVASGHPHDPKPAGVGQPAVAESLAVSAEHPLTASEGPHREMSSPARSGALNGPASNRRDAPVVELHPASAPAAHASAAESTGSISTLAKPAGRSGFAGETSPSADSPTLGPRTGAGFELDHGRTDESCADGGDRAGGGQGGHDGGGGGGHDGDGGGGHEGGGGGGHDGGGGGGQIDGPSLGTLAAQPAGSAETPIAAGAGAASAAAASSHSPGSDPGLRLSRADEGTGGTREPTAGAADGGSGDARGEGGTERSGGPLSGARRGAGPARGGGASSSTSEGQAAKPARSPSRSPARSAPSDSSADPPDQLAGAPPVAAQGATTGASLTNEELCRAAGISAETLAELERFGLIDSLVVTGVPYYDEDALTVATLASGLASFGVEPRHLRLYRNTVDRELGLIEQIITPLLRQRNPEARQRAVSTTTELVRLGETLRRSLLQREIRRQLGAG